MSIGKKNRRIAFYRPTGEVDSSNDPLPDAWELHKERWAEIKGSTGMGTVRAAGAAGGINTPLDRYSFRINYDTSITVAMQVRERDGTHHNILAVHHDKAGRNWTDVVVETGGSNA